jgi:hypothetical protein
MLCRAESQRHVRKLLRDVCGISNLSFWSMFWERADKIAH